MERLSELHRGSGPPRRKGLVTVVNVYDFTIKTNETHHQLSDYVIVNTYIVRRLTVVVVHRP